MQLPSKNHRKVFGSVVLNNVSDIATKAVSSAIVGSPVEDFGVLLTIKDLPLAWYDIPTANNMTYPRALWEVLFANDSYMDTMQNKRAYYGEDDHYDENHVKIGRISQRFLDIGFGTKPNQIIGTVEILNTEKGRNLFMLARSGGIGFSTRGLAVFLPDNDRGKDFVILEPETYFDICIDAVPNPAVSDAMFIPNQVNNEQDEQLLAASGLSSKAFRRADMQSVKILVRGKYAGSKIGDSLLVGILDDVERGRLSFEDAVAVVSCYEGDSKGLLLKEGFSRDFVVSVLDSVSLFKKSLSKK